SCAIQRAAGHRGHRGGLVWSTSILARARRAALTDLVGLSDHREVGDPPLRDGAVAHPELHRQTLGGLRARLVQAVTSGAGYPRSEPEGPAGGSEVPV